MYVLVLSIPNEPRELSSGSGPPRRQPWTAALLLNNTTTHPPPFEFRSPDHGRKPNSPKIRSKEKPTWQREREYYSSTTPGPVRSGSRVDRLKQTGLTRAPAAKVHDLAERLVGVRPHLLLGSSGAGAAPGGAEPDGRDDQTGGRSELVLGLLGRRPNHMVAAALDRRHPRRHQNPVHVTHRRNPTA